LDYYHTVGDLHKTAFAGMYHLQNYTVKSLLFYVSASHMKMSLLENCTPAVDEVFLGIITLVMTLLAALWNSIGKSPQVFSLLT